MMKRVALVGLAALAGCTVNAPSPEDLSGDAIAVKDGRLVIDDSVVPVVGNCAEGQAVVRAASGWSCVDLAAGAVVGAGLLRSGNDIVVDFGDGATQVASGARALALEETADALDVEVTDLGVRAVTDEAALSALADRVTFVEGQTLEDFFVDTCDAATVGGLRGDAAGLSVCDGVTFRAVQLVPAALSALAADYRVANVQGGTWRNAVGDDHLFLGSDVGVVNPPAPGVQGVGRVGGGTGAGFGSPQGQRLLRLPPQGFSIEVLFTGSDTIVSHGDRLQMSLFASELVVREFGRETRFQMPVAPDTARPNHVVYVHENNNVRRVYFNGLQLQRVQDATFWNGPYLGGEDVFGLGNRFGGAAGNMVYHRVRLHGLALDSTAARALCQEFSPSIVPSCG
jgi:hypothetical protein